MWKYNNLKNNLPKVVLVSEVILSLFIVAAVFVGTVDLAKYLLIVLETPPLETYEVFKNFLGHILLLVIGLELVVMLVKHSIDSLLDVLTFAIARKLVIAVDIYWDMVLGVLTLGMVIAIRKYLPLTEDHDEN